MYKNKGLTIKYLSFVPLNNKRTTSFILFYLLPPSLQHTHTQNKNYLDVIHYHSDLVHSSWTVVKYRWSTELTDAYTEPWCWNKLIYCQSSLEEKSQHLATYNLLTLVITVQILNQIELPSLLKQSIWLK